MTTDSSGYAAGDVLPEQTYTVTRAALVRYAGASGDRNPIHWSDRVARSVGLPGVIAHGMFTQALMARALDTWAGGTGRVLELGCKSWGPTTRPVSRSWWPAPSRTSPPRACTWR